jgi:hypothetical protein
LLPYLIRDGYKVSPSGRSGAEDIDIVLEMGDEKDIVQCKRGKGDIGPAVIREFYGSMMQRERDAVLL